MTRASRFRLVIAAAALVLAIGPSTRAGDAPAPTEEDRAWERALQAAAEKRGEARTLLEECVAKYPKAESVPQALQYLSWIYVATTTARDRQLALECAKRVQAEFPRSNQAHDPNWIEQMAGIHFS